MNVLVVNGSPRMAKGDTGKILASLVEGMREAGAMVETVMTREVDPRPCRGDFNCWYKRPGQCHIVDGMKSVYPKLRDAELLVLGMPLYVPMPGEMQNFINRMIPLYEPFLQTEEGRTRVRLRTDMRMSKLALVATGGWWEVENFDPLVEIVREIALKTGVEFAGAVLRPHAFIMSHFPEEEASILGSVRRAGVEMVRDQRMSSETLNEIRRPLIDQEQLRQLYNDELAKVPRSDD